MLSNSFYSENDTRFTAGIENTSTNEHSTFLISQYDYDVSYFIIIT